MPIKANPSNTEFNFENALTHARMEWLPTNLGPATTGVVRTLPGDLQLLSNLADPLQCDRRMDARLA